MDSATLLYDAHANESLHAGLSFYYGQKHRKELYCASYLCAELSVPHYVIDLSVLKPHLLGSALTDNVAMPEGHYAEDNMRLTVVPNRNMIMLSIAIAYAVSHKLDEVWFGAHSGDHSVYPDCRPEFVLAMNQVAWIANWHPVKVKAPYLEFDKAGILQRGMPLGVPYENTWTCYQGRERACGKCGSCQERLEGFAKIGRVDPLEYEVHE
jgi:7-cyano-7-deazaguanine synthase